MPYRTSDEELFEQLCVSGLRPECFSAMQCSVEYTAMLSEYSVAYHTEEGQSLVKLAGISDNPQCSFHYDLLKMSSYQTHQSVGNSKRTDGRIYSFKSSEAIACFSPAPVCSSVFLPKTLTLGGGPAGQFHSDFVQV